MTSTGGDDSRWDGSPQPSWQPTYHIQKLARSLSKDNLALAPLQRVSSTLQDVKRNGETLMLTAQRNIQRLKSPTEADEWLPQARMMPSGGQRPGLRKSSSDSSFLRPRGPARPAGEGFDWLAALNERLNQAKTSSRPKFQLPSRESFEQQVRCGMLRLQ